MNSPREEGRTGWSITRGAVALALAALLAACVGSSRHSDVTAPATSGDAMHGLVEGNARFVAGRSLHPRQTPETRQELQNSQRPFAAILGCSDSRVSPEVVFDQGLGDLFVARVAGNVIDDEILGSFEYTVEHLHTQLIVVLGHNRCGAVAAARDTIASGGHAEGHIESLVDAIRPAVEETKGQDAEATCRANVRHMVAALRATGPVLKPAVDSGALRIVGATYDLDTGKVTFLGDS